MNLNAHDKALLIALRKGNHFKANPGNVTELLQVEFGDVGPSEGKSSARRLFANGLAVFVHDSDVPNRNLMRITDNGIAYADNLIEVQRPKSLKERILSIPRSDWIAFGALLLSLVALTRGEQ